jgi:hypothetical protein
VSFDSDADPEVDSIDVDDEGVVTGSVRITNNCAECSTEMREFTFDLKEDFSDDIAAHRAEKQKAGEADDLHDELTVDEQGGSRFDEMQDTDRNGKKIKNTRYMKHLYGAEVELMVTCKCGETFSRTWRDTVPGSGMDEM